MNINHHLRDIKAYSYRGADMGRRAIAKDSTKPLHLQKVRLDNGGYDPGGAYFGGPDDIYCAFNKDFSFRIMTRANSRNEAKEIFNEDFQNLTFIR